MKKKLPLVLWNQRFYDTKYGLTVDAVDKKLSSFKTGSIILLHDTHQAQTQTVFPESTWAYDCGMPET